MKKLITLIIILIAAQFIFTGCNNPASSDDGRYTARVDTQDQSSPLAATGNITREQAIEMASSGLQPSIIQRAAVKTEIHGWYWLVVFDDLAASTDELTPYPIKGSPPGPGGTTLTNSYPGIWQSVVFTIPVDGGDRRSVEARREPEPGPYISETEAIVSAKQLLTRFISDPPLTPIEDMSWTEQTNIEAYLLGDTWVVLFWQEANPDHRLRIQVNAVTGQAFGISRG